MEGAKGIEWTFTRDAAWLRSALSDLFEAYLHCEKEQTLCVATIEKYKPYSFVAIAIAIVIVVILRHSER
jgi:hypothetical protein